MGMFPFLYSVEVCMGWGSWFDKGDAGSSSDSGDKASFKNSIDNKDGSFRSERMTRDSSSSEHYHDIAKGSTSGEYKEIYSDKHSKDK
jgi:hypothetical protein